jgi:hypothetical protein
VAIRAADMPGADELMLRIYAAMAQKERELISARTRAALAAAKARGAVLGGSRADGQCKGRTPVVPARRVVRRPSGRHTNWRWRGSVCKVESIPRPSRFDEGDRGSWCARTRGSAAWMDTTMVRVVARRGPGCWEAKCGS